jgi:CheY-specific phosphatase CheX
MPITEEAFYQIIQDTWSSTLGFQVDHADSAEFSTDRAVTVCVKISGAWEGEVGLHCSPQLARLIAAAIFQVHADKVGSCEILDALSELIHIIGGNLKALLPRPVELALPTLPDPTPGAKITPPREMVFMLTLQSEGHPFVVTLLRCFPDPARVVAQRDGDNRRLPGSL